MSMRDVGIQGGNINGDKQDVGGKGGGEGELVHCYKFFKVLKFLFHFHLIVFHNCLCIEFFKLKFLMR